MTLFANDLLPLCPTHPGEVLKDEIEYRGLSQKRLSTQMGVSYHILNEVLNAKRPVTAEFAILVEAALGLKAETLVNMQNRYNLIVARKDKRLFRRAASIRKACGMIQGKETIKEVV